MLPERPVPTNTLGYYEQPEHLTFKTPLPPAGYEMATTLPSYAGTSTQPMANILLELMTKYGSWSGVESKLIHKQCEQQYPPEQKTLVLQGLGPLKITSLVKRADTADGKRVYFFTSRIVEHLKPKQRPQQGPKHTLEFLLIAVAVALLCFVIEISVLLNYLPIHNTLVRTATLTLVPPSGLVMTALCLLAWWKTK